MICRYRSGRSCTAPRSRWSSRSCCCACRGGYSIAHYFSLLIIEGQSAIALFSNPYGENWNLFGTVDHVVDIAPLSARTVSWVQLLAIATGHVAGIVASHDRAVEVHEPQVATRSQVPMLIAMIVFGLAGLTLLLNS